MPRGKNTKWDENAQDFMIRVGQNLQARREQLNKSAIAVSKEVGLSDVQVGRIEQAKSDFSISYLQKFAEALDIDPAELIPTTKHNKNNARPPAVEPSPGGG